MIESKIGSVDSEKAPTPAEEVPATAAQLITSERLILDDYLRRGERLPTEVRHLFEAKYDNPVKEPKLGSYRDPSRKKSVTADAEVLQAMFKKWGEIDAFLEAGPRRKLAFAEPEKPEDALIVGMVTTGGLAPGLNSVVHSIVERHTATYHKLLGEGGVWGFLDSFKGLAQNREPKYIKLTTDVTEDWLDKGGAELGALRWERSASVAADIAGKLERFGVRILYVIGGDGSMAAAHEIAMAAKETIVVGVPKTMDNDVLWAWQSFGFNTAVERAAAFVNTMHCEAEATRRVAILEFFGATSGFVAANAALASGHVDLVMVPEVFAGMNKQEADAALDLYRKYLAATIRRKRGKPHAVVVIAEGVGDVLARLGVLAGGEGKHFPDIFSTSLSLANVGGETVPSFTIEPRYYVRAAPANSHDQIYCKRLGALAVDNALAGYTDFMISQWLTEYVLVPLALVTGGQKRIPPGGIFWKQVESSTGQPPVDPHSLCP